MKCKKNIVIIVFVAFVLLYDLLGLLSFLISPEPVRRSYLESMSKHVNTYFYTYISWSDRYCENNNIEPNTIIDGVYVIYINKRNTPKTYEQINYDRPLNDLANFLNENCSGYDYGYYSILDVNSSEITNIYTTTDKQTVDKILNNQEIYSFENVGGYPDAYDPNTSITSSNNVMKKIPKVTHSYFAFRLGMFIENIIRINVFFIIVFMVFIGLKKLFSKFKKDELPQKS